VSVRGVIKAGLVQAMALAFAGLLLGALAGWVSMALANGATAVAAISGKLYFVLAIVLPLLLLLMARASLEDEDRDQYRTARGAVLLSLIAGFVGGAFATGFYMVVAINVPAILGGEAQLGLRLALMERIGWTGAALVVGLTTACALLAGDWVHRRVNEG
jgi:Na+/serine symporter